MLERGARDADRAGGDLRARGLEEVQRDLEALAFLAEEPVGRDPCLVEDERAGVGGAETNLALLATGADTRVSALHKEGGDLAVELGENDGELGNAAVQTGVSRHSRLLCER